MTPLRNSLTHIIRITRICSTDGQFPQSARQDPSPNNHLSYVITYIYNFKSTCFSSRTLQPGLSRFNVTIYQLVAWSHARPCHPVVYAQQRVHFDSTDEKSICSLPGGVRDIKMAIFALTLLRSCALINTALMATLVCTSCSLSLDSSDPSRCYLATILCFINGFIVC